MKLTWKGGFWVAAVGSSAFLHVLIACGGAPPPTPEAAPRTTAAASAAAPAPAGTGYVLGPDEGDVVNRGSGKVVIKVDPRRGSPSMALGTQDLNTGAGIPMHKHESADEVLLIEQGHAHAILDGKEVDVVPGTTVYVPHGVWHAVKNTGEPVHLVWIVTPPGLEGMFRETGSAPGEPPKKLSPAEMEEIGRKHGTVFKMN